MGRARRSPRAWWIRRSPGESSLNLKSGVAYFDHQGTRQPRSGNFAIDNEIKSAAELSRKQGFETVLHTQADACAVP